MSSQTALAEPRTSHEKRVVLAIREMVSHDPSFRPFADDLDIAIDQGTVILSGNLPDRLNRQLLPLVRQAGVLNRVRNEVTTAS